MIAKKLNVEESIKYLFFGNEVSIEAFWQETESTRFPYKIIPVKEFFEISGPQLPVIYLFENGEVQAKYGYRDINENEIKDFFSDAKGGFQKMQP